MKSNKMPFIAFIAFILLLLIAMNIPHFKLPTQNKTMPVIKVNSIEGGGPIIFPQKDIYIINIFSSWCKSCRLEHKHINDFSESNPQIPIYGLVWMDQATNIRKFLKHSGNPYEKVGIIDDETAINLGATGVPEVFIIGNNGKILYHIYGGISSKKLSYAIQQAITNNNRPS